MRFRFSLHNPNHCKTAGWADDCMDAGAIAEERSPTPVRKSPGFTTLSTNLQSVAGAQLTGNRSEFRFTLIELNYQAGTRVVPGETRRKICKRIDVDQCTLVFKK